MAKGEAVAPIDETPAVAEPTPGAPSAIAGMTLSQEQFQQLLAAVRPAAPYQEPELDLANDPDVWTWQRVKDLIDAGECKVITFVPDQTIMIGWNCLYVWVMKDEENVVAEMFYNVYMDSRTGERKGREDVQKTLLNRVGSDKGVPFASFSVGWNGNSDEL